jgi:hypothetical protein
MSFDAIRTSIENQRLLVVTGCVPPFGIFSLTQQRNWNDTLKGTWGEYAHPTLSEDASATACITVKP